jgi:hypothetical protein
VREHRDAAERKKGLGLTAAEALTGSGSEQDQDRVQEAAPPEARRPGSRTEDPGASRPNTS